MAKPSHDVRAIIVEAYPELRDASFSIITQGWHSVAVDVDDRLIFKFPRDEVARQALLREAALLDIIRPRVSLPVPALLLHHLPVTFSVHEKLQGGYLLPEVYARLDENARDRLAHDLGTFYREMHSLDPAHMVTTGAQAVERWPPPEEIARKAVPLLPPRLRAWAAASLEAYAVLPEDPYGLTFGFFDGHGWNMAFDARRGRLMGVYDFADSGLGPVQQEFIYSNFIDPDLTERIIAVYDAAAGRRIDRRRVSLLTTVHRLAELAELAEDPAHAAAMLRQVEDWAAHEPP